MKEGMQIVNIQNPEWGTFTVLHREVETMWVIRGKRGTTCLSEGEFNRFWEEAKMTKPEDPIETEIMRMTDREMEAREKGFCFASGRKYGASFVRALKERSMLDPDAPDAVVFTSDCCYETHSPREACKKDAPGKHLRMEPK